MILYSGVFTFVVLWVCLVWVKKYTEIELVHLQFPKHAVCWVKHTPMSGDVMFSILRT